MVGMTRIADVWGLRGWYKMLKSGTAGAGLRRPYWGDITHHVPVFGSLLQRLDKSMCHHSSGTRNSGVGDHTKCSVLNASHSDASFMENACSCFMYIPVVGTWPGVAERHVVFSRRGLWPFGLQFSSPHLPCWRFLLVPTAQERHDCTTLCAYSAVTAWCGPIQI